MSGSTEQLPLSEAGSGEVRPVLDRDVQDVTGDARSVHTQRLLTRAAHTTDPSARQDLLDRAVTLNMPVARSVASRYYNRGIAADDLDQVAYLSLVTAVQRFDPTRGSPFVAFAVPTIRGEIRHHFRDRGWSIRPTRRIQDTQRQVVAASAELGQMLGRSPTPTELAAHAGIREDDVVEALAALSCFRPVSLDLEVAPKGEEATLIDTLSDETWSESSSDTRVVLQQLIRSLPERDRRIVGLRFYRDLTQAEIAKDVGLSQMQVSRILARTLADLREALTAQEETEPFGCARACESGPTVVGPDSPHT